ncbi:MAG: hypothetical protein GX256_02765 [Fretibacterium sp.]|nr:hypothetical protein [Fretibacterium sp.]
MGKTRFLATGLLLILGFVTGACEAAPRPLGEVLVVLRNELTKPLTASVVMSAPGQLYVARVAHTAGARVAHTYDALSEASGTIFALFTSDTQTTEQLLESLKNCPEVLAASPNRKMQVPRPLSAEPGTGGEETRSTEIGKQEAP